MLRRIILGLSKFHDAGSEPLTPGSGGEPEVRRHAAPRTILLVDDSDDARLTTKWFLASFGYSVDTARDPAEALKLFDPAIHDAVVTDNSMPGMTGAELAHIIKLRSPKTRVMLYSGQPPEDTSSIDVVLQRPAHLLALREALRKLMAGG